MRLPTFLATLGLALIMMSGLSAQSVRVIFVSGKAEIQRPDETAPRPAVKGETVIIGTRIVTGADGRLVLTPMPGVKSIVAPNSTLLLESVSETQISPTEVRHQAMLELKEGSVISDLQKPEGVTYDYNVRTARGVAGARGTTFTVGINAAGIQTIIVTHGTIEVNFADGRQISLKPGQLSITQANGETQSVNNISELPPADQEAAQAVAEASLSAILNALEAGIELDPAALENALQAVQDLGIELDPELQTLIESVLDESPMDPLPMEPAENETITEVITEIMSEDAITGFASIDDFIVSLDDGQQAAFAAIRTAGNYNDTDLTLLLKDGKDAAGVVNLIDLYIEISTGGYDINVGQVLTDLGILGNNNFTAVGSDTEGLRALILAYGFIDNSAVLKLDEQAYADATRSAQTITGSSNVFFPGVAGGSGMTLYNVIFDASSGSDPSSLYVGATRELIINNTGLNADTFVTQSGIGFGILSLHASDKIDLNNTRFNNDITYILMEAATINLANITFQVGSIVQLNSKFGGAHFGSSEFGKVNLITNVKYGATLLSEQNFGDAVRGTSADASGGSISIGSLGGSTTPNTVGGGTGSTAK